MNKIKEIIQKLCLINNKVIFIAILLPFSLLAVNYTYSYDDAGRLIGINYGSGAGITYTYDNNGNLLQRQSQAIVVENLAIYSSAPSNGSTIEMTPVDIPQGDIVASKILTITNAADAVTDNNLDLNACSLVNGTTITVTPSNLTASIAFAATGVSVEFNCSSAVVGNFTDTYNCPFSIDNQIGNEDTASYTVNCNIGASELIFSNGFE